MLLLSIGPPFEAMNPPVGSDVNVGQGAIAIAQTVGASSEFYRIMLWLILFAA